MKASSSFNLFLGPVSAAALGFSLLASCSHAGPPAGRGMPEAERAQIHALFENHAKIQRTVTPTKDGYVALTESDDPKVAKALQTHVTQMGDRLESGLRVRRWDPAFDEYVNHYADMDHQFEKTAKGVKMTVKGRTDAAAKVARNHASVVSAFVAHGWAEHDRRHDAVAD